MLQMRKLPDRERSLSKRSQRLSAKGKALSFLSRREHSTFELKAKLLRAGYEPAEVEETLTWVQEKKFQSDQRFSESLHRRRAANYGDRAIQAELTAHHLELGHVNSDEVEVPTEAQRVHDWLTRRQKSKYLKLLELSSASGTDSLEFLKLKSKCFRSLSHRGFEFRNIEQGWKMFVSEISSDRC